MKLKRKLKWFVIHGIALAGIALCFFMLPEEMIQIKQQIYGWVDGIRHAHDDKEYDNSEEYPVMSHSGTEWYQSNRLIYHAAGGIDGLTYTNSREALERMIGNENWIQEIDFGYTSDGVLVCVHEWSDITDSAQPLSLQDFLAIKIYGKYSPMTGEDVVEYMHRNPQLHVVLDSKDADTLRIVEDLMELCGGDPALMNRFIVQLYDGGVKPGIVETYPFPDENFLFTAYKFGAERYSEIMGLCFEESIRVVTIPSGFWEQEIIDLFRSKEIFVYEHTINRPDKANASIEKGIYGVYTDFLEESDLQLPD